MSKVYTRAQREHALYLIDQLDHIPTVSTMLNIPQSTLRDWWNTYLNHRKLWEGRHNPNPNPAQAYTALAVRTLLDQIARINDALGVPPPANIPP